MIEVRYERGVYLPQQDFWLDPWDAKRFAFVSHAHSDHIAPHQEVIVSERTARLMRLRLPGISLVQRSALFSLVSRRCSTLAI